MMLGMIIMMGQRAAASAKRIYEILDEQPTIVDRPGAVDLVECPGDVRFDARRLRLLRRRADGARPDFDLHLEPGRDGGARRPHRVGQVDRGPAARPLLRLDRGRGRHRRPRRARPDARQPAGQRRDRARRAVPVLGLDPRQHRLRAPDADIDEIEAAAEAAGADEFIAQLADGYDTVVGERGYTLSGGQRQRIAIARTLLVNPPILVLDDATSAIDVQVEQRIHGALRDADGGPDDADHRPPPVDDQPRRPGGADRRRPHRRRRHARRAAGDEPLYAEVLAQADDRPRRHRR